MRQKQNDIIYCDVCKQKITKKLMMKTSIKDRVEGWFLGVTYKPYIYYGGVNVCDVCVPCYNSFLKWKKSRVSK